MMDGALCDEINASELRGLKPTCLDPLLPDYLVEWGKDLLVIGGNVAILAGALKGEKVNGTLVRGR